MQYEVVMNRWRLLHFLEDKNYVYVYMYVYVCR